jgi:hypothetical protein
MVVGDAYELVMGSDTARGGMYLELWAKQPRELALWAFYSDAGGSIESVTATT